MKKFLFMLVVLAALGLVAPVSADYYLAGSFNGWDAAGQLMTDNFDGTYSATVTGMTASNREEFKVTDGTWDTTFPPANSWLFADGSGNATVTFNTNIVSDGWDIDQYRIGVNNDAGTWSVVGSLNGWDNADPALAMTAQGGGIYKVSKTLSAGTYEWKVVNTGSWDAIGGDGRSINASNISLTTTIGFEDVDFYVNALNGTVRADVIPEPATMTLLGIGSLLLASVRRKK